VSHVIAYTCPSCGSKQKCASQGPGPGWVECPSCHREVRLTPDVKTEEKADDTRN